MAGLVYQFMYPGMTEGLVVLRRELEPKALEVTSRYSRRRVFRMRSKRSRAINEKEQMHMYNSIRTKDYYKRNSCLQKQNEKLILLL